MDPLHIEVAGFSLAIYCEDGGLYSYMEKELAAFRGGRGKDMVLRVDLVRESELPGTISDLYALVSPVRGLQVLLHHEAEKGELLLKAIACQTSEYDLDDEVILYPMLLNTLLSSFLQCLKAESRAHMCLIHACAVVRDERALVFAGASGAGKSTAAKLLAEDGSYALLGDDMVPVARTDSGWRAYASPLGGDIPRDEISNISAPLQAIYFLSQEGEAGWHRQDMAQALASLMSSVVPANEIRNSANQSIDEYDRESLGDLMDDASLLAVEVPCFSLAYQLDEPLWDQIFQAEKDKEGV